MIFAVASQDQMGFIYFGTGTIPLSQTWKYTLINEAFKMFVKGMLNSYANSCLVLIIILYTRDVQSWVLTCQIQLPFDLVHILGFILQSTPFLIVSRNKSLLSLCNQVLDMGWGLSSSYHCVNPFSRVCFLRVSYCISNLLLLF